MGNSRVIGFNAAKWEKDLINYWVGQQNARFIAYAKKKIMDIGNRMSHKEKTGNLLDSLCWGLSYNQQLVSYGFYRNKKATEQSYLHEWWKGASWRKRSKKAKAEFEKLDHWNLPEIHGHEMAEHFISIFANSARAKHDGWTLFFAVLAPYWGYWEEGFTMRSFWGSKRVQFPVMAETYDMIKSDLKGARIPAMHVHVEKYTNTGLAKTALRGKDKILIYK